MMFNLLRQRWSRSLATCFYNNYQIKTMHVRMICSTLGTSSSTSCHDLCNIVCTMNGSLDDLESSLEHSHVQLTSSIVMQVIEACKTEAPVRRLLRFFTWSRIRLSCHLDDTSFNAVIRIFAQLKDFTAIDILITELGNEARIMETETFSNVVEALVKMGKEDKALDIFKKLQNFKCPHDSVTVAAIVRALCEKGHVIRAEGIVLHHKDKIHGAKECIYRSLLHGWTVQEDVKNARRILKEMKSNGIQINLFCYNTFLRCLCYKHMKTDPSRLVPNALNVVMEMVSNGVEPSSISYNIILTCLGKIRRVKESLRILDSMRKTGCPPDWVSYYLVIRVLYLSGRFGKGNQILNHMFDEEGQIPEYRFYHDLIRILCGVERLNFALNLFERMKRNSVGYYGPMYDVLIPKLCRNGEFDTGKKLWNEAISMGISLQCSYDELNPLVTQVFKPKRRTETEVFATGSATPIKKFRRESLCNGNKSRRKKMKKKRIWRVHHGMNTRTRSRRSNGQGFRARNKYAVL